MYVVRHLIVFTILIQSIESWSEYCKLRCNGKKHTVCRREPCPANPLCGPNYRMAKFSDAERTLIVENHNKYRNKVAAGELSSNGMPSASNMHVISYSKELEFIAQCWSNNCNVGGSRDSCCRTDDHECVGQNIFTATSEWNTTINIPIDYIIEKWFQLYRIVPADTISSFKPGSFRAFDNFMQLMWAKTTQVGCGRMFFGDSKQDNNLFVVCNYTPCGGILGQPIYSSGSPCSHCEGRDTCNSEFTSLCGKITPASDDKFVAPFVLGAVVHQLSDFILVLVIALWFIA